MGASSLVLRLHSSVCLLLPLLHPFTPCETACKASARHRTHPSSPAICRISGIFIHVCTTLTSSFLFGLTQTCWRAASGQITPAATYACRYGMSLSSSSSDVSPVPTVPTIQHRQVRYLSRCIVCLAVIIVIQVFLLCVYGPNETSVDVFVFEAVVIAWCLVLIRLCLYWALQPEAVVFNHITLLAMLVFFSIAAVLISYVAHNDDHDHVYSFTFPGYDQGLRWNVTITIMIQLGLMALFILASACVSLALFAFALWGLGRMCFASCAREVEKIKRGAYVLTGRGGEEISMPSVVLNVYDVYAAPSQPQQ